MRITSLGLSLVLLATPALALPRMQTLEKSPIAEKYKSSVPTTMAEIHDRMAEYRAALVEKHDELAKVINEMDTDKLTKEQKNKLGIALMQVSRMEGQIDLLDQIIEVTKTATDE